MRKSKTYQLDKIHIPIEPEHQDNVVSMEQTPIDRIIWSQVDAKGRKSEHIVEQILN